MSPGAEQAPEHSLGRGHPAQHPPERGRGQTEAPQPVAAGAAAHPGSTQG